MTEKAASEGSSQGEGAQAPADDFKAALREATAAKAGKSSTDDAGAATGQAATNQSAEAAQAAEGDKKGEGADTAANADAKKAGADTAAGKATEGSPKNAEIQVDWSKVEPALKAAYDAGSPDTKKALEATVRRDLKRGQEIAQLRKTVSQGKTRRPPASTSSRPARTVDLKKVLDGDKMKALEKDAPEVTAAVREVIGPMIADLENANRHLDGLSAQEVEQDALEQEGILAEHHPDWDTATSSKEFSDWLGKAAPYIQQMVSRNAVKSEQFPNGRLTDGLEAATVLTLFKQSTGFGSAAGDQPPAGSTKKDTEGSQQPSPVDKKRALQRESAKSPDLRSPGATSGVAEDDFKGNLREATRLKALERQRQSA